MIEFGLYKEQTWTTRISMRLILNHIRGSFCDCSLENQRSFVCTGSGLFDRCFTITFQTWLWALLLGRLVAFALSKWPLFISSALTSSLFRGTHFALLSSYEKVALFVCLVRSGRPSLFNSLFHFAPFHFTSNTTCFFTNLTGSALLFAFHGFPPFCLLFPHLLFRSSFRFSFLSNKSN